MVYNGGVFRSQIDTTFINDGKSRLVCDWKVEDQYTGSLHSYITYQFTHGIQKWKFR